ncbi:Transcription initiation factor TFIID subunit 13 [Linum perenne]
MSGSGAPGQASKSSKVVGPSSHPSEPSTKRKLGVFQKDLQRMMYGFGDDPNPIPESVALLEDILVEYVTDLTHKALDVGSTRAKISVEDFLYVIRKDPPKLNRSTELLSMQKELTQARKVLTVDDEASLQ